MISFIFALLTGFFYCTGYHEETHTYLGANGGAIWTCPTGKTQAPRNGPRRRRAVVSLERYLTAPSLERYLDGSSLERYLDLIRSTGLNDPGIVVPSPPSSRPRRADV